MRILCLLGLIRWVGLGWVWDEEGYFGREVGFRLEGGCFGLGVIHSERFGPKGCKISKKRMNAFHI